MPAYRQARSAGSDVLPRRQGDHVGVPVYPPANLSPQLTRFIGREHELSEVKRQLDMTRLLTLIGAGGCDKTPPSLLRFRGALDKQRT